ncbi:DUF2089 domain-containing protein [bacterium]|nr:DUF2089 domain-containing protein [bacterium]
MQKPLKQCPVCSDKLFIKAFKCTACRTEISGEFDVPVGHLDLEREIIDFIKIFIYAEGNIKQSEKMLNCSYPKIKNLLKKTKTALGIQDEKTSQNISVIDRLDSGEIDVEDALKQLRK